VADECDSVHLGGYPGPLRKLLGIWVEEVDALSPAEKNSVEFVAPFGEAPRSLPCGLICERVHLEGAEELAVFGHDFYAGEPVFTRHQYGEGKAYYLASALDAESLRPVLREICSIAGVLPVVDRLPEGLEIMLRVAPDGTVLWYLLNHSKETLNLPLPPGGYRDLLTGQSVKGEIWLPALQVAILVAD
jgi:beta-galactosidase